MKPEEFLHRLNKLPEETRGSYSATVLSLSKVAVAEVASLMLKDRNFAVKINALKAIRKFELDIYEKEILQSLLDDSTEVKIAAIKTLASFGDFKHFPLIQAFYGENPDIKPLIIDSFTNYSDNESAYIFILGELVSDNKKIEASVIDWFNKAFNHQMIYPWILSAYKHSTFIIQRKFEKIFADKLHHLFYDLEVGNRFKLITILEKYKGAYGAK